MVKFECSTTLLDSLDIWNENGDIVTSKLNEPFRNFIDTSDFIKASQFIEELSSSQYYETNANKIRELKSLLNQFKNMADLADNNYESILLNKSNTKSISIKSCSNLSELEPGKYIIFYSHDKYSNFDKDFDCLESELKKLLITKDFNVKVSRNFPTRFMIMENAKVHDFHRNFYTISDGDNYYDPNNASVLASQTTKSFVKKKLYKYIDNALVLPFEHASNNYYHNLTECLFGLRSFDYNSYDWPIIYTEDRFNIIPTLAERLSINIDRFLSINDVADCIIKRAYCFYKGGYYWDKSIYEFSKKIKKDVSGNNDRKVYISRSKSARSYNNEKEIESFLSRRGFEIVHAEDLSFSEQVDLFSACSFLISSHGAGLTNICFMKPKSRLIEFFRPDMIKADYYLRSIHNDMDYSLMIFDNDMSISKNVLKELL
ncbi:glycosyltransferase family 61 protein [Psychrobacter celer]|uniref:glycosyltransferase family 61 protein n=1 Tax=Psychrobacter celer TaxID=306572 RepID=UPI003FD088FD